MKIHTKNCLLFLVLGLPLQADTLERVEYVLGRALGQTVGLNARVTDLENVENGDPSVPFTNWDGNEYPVELASGQVELLHISGLSRFPRSQAALRIPNIQDFGGIWYRNVIASSWINVNPHDEGNFIVACEQDRSNMQGPLGVIGYVSTTAGFSWDQPNTVFSRCQGTTPGHSNADFQCASKPFVAYDSTGSNAYLIYIGSNDRLPNASDTGPNLDEAILITCSQTEGTSWNAPQIISGDDGVDHWMLNPGVFANSALPGAVYAIWTDLQYFVGNGNNSITRLSRSTNGGTVWDPSQDIVIVDSSIGNFAPVGSQILTSPFGPTSLYLLVKSSQLYTPYATAQWNAIISQSVDNGVTWNTFYNLFPNLNINVAQDPDVPGTYIRSAPTTFDSAINPYDGTLYAVTQSDLICGPGLGGVILTSSTNGGLTWTPGIAVNPDTLSAQAFNPSVAVNDNNQVGVLFYDFRNHTPGSPALETDVWLAVYNEDLSERIEEIRITPVSFDMRQAMRASLEIIGIPGGAIHYYIGDYCKLQASLNNFVACFPVTNPPYGVGPSPLPTTTYAYDGRHRQDILFAQIIP